MLMGMPHLSWGCHENSGYESSQEDKLDVDGQQKKDIYQKGRWHDLADEIWFHIYDYLHLDRSLADEAGANFTFGFIFRTISLVSKDHSKRLLHYAQEVPHDFVYHGFPFGIHEILWACKHYVKVGSVDLSRCKSVVECNLFMYFLRCYNVKDMHTLRIALDQDCLYMGNWLHGEAIQSEIPLEVMDSLITFSEFQRDFAELVPSRTQALKKLDLSIRKKDIHIPFFSGFSSTLENLTLSIDGSHQETQSGSLDGDLEKITESIECMPMLKKLTLKVSFPVSFRIKSLSLEEIDTTSSIYGFWVDECICRSLKVFRCRYLDQMTRNGISPDPILMNGVIASKKEIKFRVGSHPCKGMKVPDCCNINLLT